MSPIDWYKMVLTQKYTEFAGRARRSEFWNFALVSLGIVVVLTALDNMLGLNRDEGAGILASLYALAVALPSLGVSIRRLHDTGKSGWWVLLGFIPVIGLIALIYFFAQEGEAVSNKWGANPKS